MWAVHRVLVETSRLCLITMVGTDWIERGLYISYPRGTGNLQPKRTEIILLIKLCSTFCRHHMGHAPTLAFNRSGRESTSKHINRVEEYSLLFCGERVV